jgi:hypothetical protein
MPFIPESGMTNEHFEKFQEAAKDQQVIALVRHTNTKSTELIKRGCPGKPMSIKINTSEVTGVVTASNPGEVETAQREGYYVVEPGNRVARGYMTQNGRRVLTELKLANPFWTVAPGQLIDPKLQKPLAGDYDLMSVIDPRTPGQNIAAVASDGRTIANVESPIVKRFKDSVNGKLDMPRVHHGAQDQYAGFRGGATAFFPDGRVLFLPDAAAVEEFFNLIGRQTRLGRYPSPSSLQRNGIRVVPARGLSVKLKEKGRAIAGNQAAMEWLGQTLGVSIQWLGDIGTRRQIQRELTTTHAKEIEENLAGGRGVLVIIRMQEWIIPDFNGMRARGLLAVYVEGGETQGAALDRWQKPKLLKGPPWGWRTYEEYFWLDPKY